MHFSDIQDRLAIWTSRSSESRLIKYIRTNPVHPFDRRACGVYVLNHLHTNHLTTASLLLIASIAYFASLASDSTTFSRLDIVFFPCIAFLIGLLILWRNVWTYSLVLNYPAFRYEYYIGQQIISVGPITDAFIRLKLLFAGEEDMFYKIVVGASHAPELDLTRLSANGPLYREVARRLARTLDLNYFDVMDLSHLHECRHATSRHLRTVMRMPVNMESMVSEDVERRHLTSSLDRLMCHEQNPLECAAQTEACNWPFWSANHPNLGVPVETVRRFREEKQTRETWAWRVRNTGQKVRNSLRAVKIGLLGKDVASAQRDAEIGHHIEYELTEIEKAQLIRELRDVERDIRMLKYSRWLLRLKTNTLCRKEALSVEQREIMQLVARFMVLRNTLRTFGQSVPGITAELGFIWMYTAHSEYSKFYHRAMQDTDPGCGVLCRKGIRVHPVKVTPSGREVKIKQGICTCCNGGGEVHNALVRQEATRSVDNTSEVRDRGTAANSEASARITEKPFLLSESIVTEGIASTPKSQDTAEAGATNIVVITEGEIVERPVSEVASTVVRNDFEETTEKPSGPDDNKPPDKSN
ncbi:uncharacterized protein LOC129590534 [Paramacrobiotus metropolitanus]|uniref:uncharacterized protein LOC129590534 n=1 Tax=Paramacrobiotus metropolitanus TaxID=2943436 RepID=UPI00244580A1|nr:uncharacterized protein LOC129590534 [Paramacrobiotus metropolitanus]